MHTYAHLAPEVVKKLSLSDKERIAWIEEDRWVEHPNAQLGLGKLSRLLNMPNKTRMPNLLVVGEPNSGKSTICERFYEMHPRVLNSDDDYVKVPVMYVQCPPTADESGFYGQILDDLYAVYKSSDSISVKRTQVLKLFRLIELKVLIIDEIHNLLAGRNDQQRIFLNSLKYLSNSLQISIVAIGTYEAMRAIAVDPQLSSRFPTFFVERWKFNDEYRQLIKSFELLLPLKLPSRLYQREIAKKLHSMTSGLIGELSELLNLLAVSAIESGAEMITLTQISEFRWVSPSRKKLPGN